MVIVCVISQVYFEYIHTHIYIFIMIISVWLYICLNNIFRLFTESLRNSHRCCFLLILTSLSIRESPHSPYVYSVQFKYNILRRRGTSIKHVHAHNLRLIFGETLHISLYIYIVFIIDAPFLFCDDRPLNRRLLTEFT